MYRNSDVSYFDVIVYKANGVTCIFYCFICVFQPALQYLTNEELIHKRLFSVSLALRKKFSVIFLTSASFFCISDSEAWNNSSV